MIPQFRCVPCRLRRLDLIARVKLDVTGDTDSYYLYDGLGSTTGLTDGSGAVTFALEFRQRVVPPSRIELPFPA